MPDFTPACGDARQRRRPGRRCGAQEISYTASVNLTKVAGKHEIRTGFDFVRLDAGPLAAGNRQPARRVHFGGGITGHAGLHATGVGGWNGYAAFLLGLMSGYGKSVQFEEMTGRENQYGCTSPTAGRSTRS